MGSRNFEKPGDEPMGKTGGRALCEKVARPFCLYLTLRKAWQTLEAPDVLELSVGHCEWGLVRIGREVCAREFALTVGF